VAISLARVVNLFAGQFAENMRLIAAFNALGEAAGLIRFERTAKTPATEKSLHFLERPGKKLRASSSQTKHGAK
jgi:hypothetical protein